MVAIKWTTRKIKYIEGQADDGAAVIANQLGRSMQTAKTQAMRYRLALRRALRSPKCGMHVHTSLSLKAGWCRACTLEHRNERIAGRVRRLKEGVRREGSVKREHQRLYSARYGAKINSITRDVLMTPRFTGGNAKRNEDSQTKNYPDAPGHHSLSARKCQPAKQNATRPMRIPVEIEWENQMPFK